MFGLQFNLGLFPDLGSLISLPAQFQTWGFIPSLLGLNSGYRWSVPTHGSFLQPCWCSLLSPPTRPDTLVNCDSQDLAVGERIKAFTASAVATPDTKQAYPSIVVTQRCLCLSSAAAWMDLYVTHQPPTSWKQSSQYTGTIKTEEMLLFTCSDPDKHHTCLILNKKPPGY